jgi:hypothetical protein
VIPVNWAGVLEYWSIVEDPGFFRGSIGNNSFEMPKSPLNPSLQYSSTPIINKAL